MSATHMTDRQGIPHAVQVLPGEPQSQDDLDLEERSSPTRVQSVTATSLCGMSRGMSHIAFSEISPRPVMRRLLLSPTRLLLLALCSVVACVPFVLAAGQQIRRVQPEAGPQGVRQSDIVMMMMDNTVERHLDGFDRFAVTTYQVSAAIALAFVLLQLLFVPFAVARSRSQATSSWSSLQLTAFRYTAVDFFHRPVLGFMQSMQLTGRRFWLRYMILEAISVAPQWLRLCVYSGTSIFSSEPTRIEARSVVVAQATLLVTDLMLLCVTYMGNLRMLAISASVCPRFVAAGIATAPPTMPRMLFLVGSTWVVGRRLLDILGSWGAEGAQHTPHPHPKPNTYVEGKPEVALRAYAYQDVHVWSAL